MKTRKDKKIAHMHGNKGVHSASPIPKTARCLEKEITTLLDKTFFTANVENDITLFPSLIPCGHQGLPFRLSAASLARTDGREGGTLPRHHEGKSQSWVWLSLGAVTVSLKGRIPLPWGLQMMATFPKL